MFAEFINDKTGKNVLINVNSIVSVDPDECPAFTMITLNDCVGSVYKVRGDYQMTCSTILEAANNAKMSKL